MKALILKDFRAYRLFYTLILLLIFLYAYLNVRFGSVDGIIGFLVVFLPSLSAVILFIGDEPVLYYVTALPTNRKSIVLSKYTNTYLSTVILLTVIFGVIYYLSFSNPDAKADLEMLLTLKGILFSVTPTTLIVSICYPLLFRYGLKTGVRILMGVFAVAYGLGIVLVERLLKMNFLLERRGIFYSSMKALEHYEEANGTLSYWIFLIFLITLLLVSMTLSVKWFNKKDVI